MNKIDTPQTDLNGQKVKKLVYQTEDEGPQNMSAGKLDETGVDFRFCFLIEHEGSFVDKATGEKQPFYTAEGKIMDERGKEQDFSLLFGSKRLFAVLDKVKYDHIRDPAMGVDVNVSGHGTGFDRNYQVKVL
jgi:hypothetical protein